MALEKLAKAISGTVEIFDPYDSLEQDFCSESGAYSYFNDQIGLEIYGEKLEERIKEIQETVSLLGFSIGASAIWDISKKSLRNVSGALCFYSSQIRHFPEIIPAFPIKLVFPIHEKHFSVPKLIAQLSQTEQVAICQTQFLHGFMNIDSPNFNSDGYAKYLNALSEVPHGKCLYETGLKNI